MNPKHKLKLTLTVFLALAIQIQGWQPVNAWNDFGHMAVAYIAYKKLNPQTRERVNALLKLNPYYSKWKTELVEKEQKGDLDTQIFMLASTWPDLIKKDPSYVSDGASEGNRPVGTESKRNTGYDDHLMHKYWHFYDKSFSRDGSKGIKIPSPNAISQLAAFRKVIASKTKPDTLKSYDLNWIIHITGDLHQPLHCATRISKHEPDGDNGGNNIYVNYGSNPKPSRLHWFWDSCLGSGLVNDARKFAETLGPADQTLALDTNTKTWLKESFDLTQSHVYIPPIQAGNGPFDLTREYQNQARELSKMRVALAGERLARILNKELK